MRKKQPFDAKKFWIRRTAILLVSLMSVWLYVKIMEPGKMNSAAPSKSNMSQMRLSSLTEKSILNLHREKKMAHSNYVHLQVKGVLDGKAQIIAGDITGDGRSVYLLSPGKVDLTVNILWKEPKLSLMYIPDNVGSGELTISYEFRK